MIAEDKLRETMGAVLEVDPGRIGPETSTDTVASWDSLKHMRLVIALEEAFDVTIPDDDVVTMTSYAIIKMVIEEQLEQR